MKFVSVVLLAIACRAIAAPSSAANKNSQTEERDVEGLGRRWPQQNYAGSISLEAEKLNQILPRQNAASSSTTRSSTTTTTTRSTTTTTTTRPSTSTTTTTRPSTTTTTTTRPSTTATTTARPTTNPTTTTTTTTTRSSTTTSRAATGGASTVDATLATTTTRSGTTTTTSSRTTTTTTSPRTTTTTTSSRTTTTTTSSRTTTTTTSSRTSTTTTTTLRTSTTTTTTTRTTTTTTTTRQNAATKTYDVTGKAYNQVMLDVHNLHRANHSLPNLVWNQDLADTAQSIANNCVYGHNVTADGGGYGQNIGAGAPGNAAAGLITNLMYNGEINYYPLPYGDDNPNLDNFHIWGHYSQLVWTETTDVGCVTKYCPNGLSNTGPGVAPYFTVCNYDPPGNYVGEFSQVAAPIGGATYVVVGS